jgi:hypothetical protein
MQHTVQSRFARKRRLFVESLEGRQLMAADLQLAATPLVDFTSELVLDHVADLVANHDDELPHIGTYPRIPESAVTAASETLVGGLAAALAPLTSIPALNSLAGAAASLYLDFNGHFDAVWGSYSNVTTPAFDQDGNATSFSDSELTTIRNVWAQVAEDFAPFKINVTTIEPASFANGVSLRVAIGGNGDWLGGGAGGVAYINSFTNSVVNTAYVFPKALANGYFKYVAEASSHEAGHAFGLEHQSLYSAAGTKIEEYNPGTSSLAPIMGNSYSATRGQWARDYNSRHVMQDDLAVLSRSANGFGYRADDHGNSVGAATELIASGNTISGSGIIHQTSDADYFSFVTGGGQVSLNVAVAQFNNLDARLELRDAAGTLIVSATPTTSFGATINTTLAAGSYQLVVASQGNYGDLGQYTVSGTIVPVVVSTVNAPSGLTVARNEAGAALQWTDNATNEAEVLVERRIAGGAWGVVARLSADSTSYVDGTVAAGVTYEYRVQAIGLAAVSGYSNAVSVTFAPPTPTGLTATATSATRVSLSWSNVGGESGYKVERLVGGVWTQIGTTAANVVTYQNTTTAGTTYSYRVRAYNTGGNSAYSATADVTTPVVVTRPKAPSSLVASINADGHVQLSWKDNSTNETAFVVQRSTNGYSWTTLSQTPANSTGTIDSTAAAGRTYYYRVYATNSAGNSTASYRVRVVTPALTSWSNQAAAARFSTIRQPNSSSTSVTTGATAAGTTASASKSLIGGQAWTVSDTTSLAAPSPSGEWQSAVDSIFASLRSSLAARRA